ncbi:MAG TPA: hypothetical protein VNX21_05190 [Candidatus Thermoplasmatota archaeon]|nr:hypothetical protein [Candidatus Thermoplasmatota archaeon]
MAAGTPGPTAGTRKLERGAHAARQRSLRLLLSLAMQAALLLVLLVAAALAQGQARWLYLWAAVVPAGFSVVYVMAFRRGERVRREGAWTPAWEAAESRRNYAWLGVVGALFVAGALGILALS